MPDPKIRLAISTCPNDTFAFAALMQRRVDWRGIDFEIELLDIQQLNDGLMAGRFDVAKTSFHAALLLADRVSVLPCASALGFGVGPLLLAARSDTRPEHASQRTLCPGQHTTAAMLFQLFYPHSTRVSHVVFSDIMPMLQQGQADFGVCIHEGRFTWQDQGLSLVEDLGSRWESLTQCPLPLGGLVARNSLSGRVVQNVIAVIGESLALAMNDPQSALPVMRRHAQEFNDRVLMRHVELYVNQWTVDLGDQGRRALDELSRQAARVGLLPESVQSLAVWGDA